MYWYPTTFAIFKIIERGSFLNLLRTHIFGVFHIFYEIYAIVKVIKSEIGNQSIYLFYIELPLPINFNQLKYWIFSDLKKWDFLVTVQFKLDEISKTYKRDNTLSNERKLEILWALVIFLWIFENPTLLRNDLIRQKIKNFYFYANTVTNNYVCICT